MKCCNLFYLRRERYVEPLTIVNFCNATKEKTLAKEYAKYATYLLKVIKGCQLRDTHSKLFAMKTSLSSLFIYQQINRLCWLTKKANQYKERKENAKQKEFEFHFVSKFHFAFFSHLSCRAVLKTGCNNYGVGLLPADVLRNQDSADHPPQARFMICSTTHKLTLR